MPVRSVKYGVCARFSREKTRRITTDRKLAFRIYTDGRPVFYSGLMTGGDPAQHVSLPIYGVSEISIETESRNDKRGANYAVIAVPVLNRVKSIPKQGLTY